MSSYSFLDKNTTKVLKVQIWHGSSKHELRAKECSSKTSYGKNRKKAEDVHNSQKPIEESLEEHSTEQNKEK